ncbi:MAG: flagellar biosynthesis protein FliQ [Marinicaulis sp.]|nr:flagellar biosynthesis protein FliQ [Marinicaulis sp.]NNL88382.1 flagellar biosynthesis protein FliQ [Marinicaulis sp.]
MNGAEILEIARDAFWVTLMVAGPAMLAGLAVGLSIALLQALTQVQELTLVFVPRIIIMFITIAICLPFMGGALGRFATELYARIATSGIGGG